MLILLSPSKTLDYHSSLLTQQYTLPELLQYSTDLIQCCQKLSVDDISQLMKISGNLAEVNYHRFQNWQPDFNLSNARQAILAFKGDVYEGLAVDDFTQLDFDYAQKHLRILSGLYGLLKPLDLIQPYRLEMGIKLKNGTHNNLYQFWDDIITKQLVQQLSQNENLINLASNEYFKVIKTKQLHHKVIEPIFLDESKGDFKVISFYAKKARGLMSRYIIKHQLSNIKDVQSFNLSGYQYNKQLSSENKWIFRRSEEQLQHFKESN